MKLKGARLIQPKTKVLVTVPNMGWFRKEVAYALLNLMRDNKGYDLTYYFPSATPLENSQSKIILDIRQKRFDWWLNLDDDTVPMRNPLDLIALDKDLIGLPTPIWVQKADGNEYFHMAAYRWSEERDVFESVPPPPEDMDLQEVDGFGGACFLIKGRVFDHPDLQSGAFLRTWKPDGTLKMGNDLAFCRRAKNAGFRLWVHWAYCAGHIKEVDLAQVMTICAKIEQQGYATSTKGTDAKEHGAQAFAPGHQPKKLETSGLPG